MQTVQGCYQQKITRTKTVLQEIKILIYNKGTTKKGVLYCRLSVEDIKDDDGNSKKNSELESNSISNQKQILSDYAKKHGYKNIMFFVDDGISGTSFDRSDFQRMQRMAEEGKIGTIIVKDLSRFGREHIEGDHLVERVYPVLGITFISIHENINSSTGEGMEMLPFYNIFNEWYAAQTSKKIREVWAYKSENGERVSANVPFGYKKSEEDKKQWIIDEPAAKVVRYIFKLCLEGLGITKIARRLESEKILTPTAYFQSIGRKTRNKTTDPYRWSANSVQHILDNMQYTGCTVNFKSTTVSFKVHKTVYNPEDEWVIIPDTQEAIIDKDTWERVKEVKKHRRRNTATGRTSIFSGLIYCGDCGSRLYFCAAKSVKENQEFYRCSNYKENRGSCSIHFIRNVVLEKLVLKLIREAAEYITEFEPVFMYLYSKQHKLNKVNNLKVAKQEIEKNKQRIKALDKLIEAAFEKNVLGTLRDDLFTRMTANYEKEQKELLQAIAKAEEMIANAEKDKIDLRAFLSIIRKCTDLKELTPELVNRLITRIEVFNSEKDENGKKHVPIKVHFIGVGILTIPDAEQILKTYDEIRNNPLNVA